MVALPRPAPLRSTDPRAGPPDGLVPEHARFSPTTAAPRPGAGHRRRSAGREGADRAHGVEQRGGEELAALDVVVDVVEADVLGLAGGVREGSGEHAGL